MLHYLISLSAKTDIALKERARALHGWLLEKYSKENSLSAISYTLNVGRDHYKHRCVWIVKSKEELQQALDGYLTDIAHLKGNFFSGIVDQDKLEDEAIYQRVLKMTLRELSLRSDDDLEGCNSDLNTLANLYVKGYEFDWLQLYKGDAKQRISLPTYPFAKERHWIQTVKNDGLIISNHVNNRQFDANKITKLLMKPCSITKEDILNSIRKEDIQYLSPDQVEKVYNILFSAASHNEINKPAKSNSRLDEQSIKSIIKKCISEILKIDKIEDQDVLQSYGLDSISGIKLTADLENKLHISIDPQWLIDYPTVSKLSIRIEDFISKQKDNMVSVDNLSH